MGENPLHAYLQEKLFLLIVRTGFVELHASPWEQVPPFGGPGIARLGDAAGLRPGDSDWQSLHSAGAMGHLC